MQAFEWTNAKLVKVNEYASFVTWESLLAFAVETWFDEYFHYNDISMHCIQGIPDHPN